MFYQTVLIGFEFAFEGVHIFVQNAVGVAQVPHLIQRFPLRRIVHWHFLLVEPDGIHLGADVHYSPGDLGVFGGGQPLTRQELLFGIQEPLKRSLRVFLLVFVRLKQYRLHAIEIRVFLVGLFE